MFCERCSDEFDLMPVPMPEVTTMPVPVPEVGPSNRILSKGDGITINVTIVGFCLPKLKPEE